MNRRQVMYRTNKIAKDWMLSQGYKEIWFKAHTRRKDRVWNKDHMYYATDLWNLFDGICFDASGYAVFFQVKTNAYPKTQPYKEFHWEHALKVLLINVKKDKKGKWIVLHSEIS